jgi:hypothetical protein
MERASAEVLSRMKSATRGPIPVGCASYWSVIRVVSKEFGVKPLDLDVAVRKLMQGRILPP